MGLAIKQSLILVKSDLIHNLLCELHYGITISKWSEETLFEKSETLDLLSHSFRIHSFSTAL